MNDLTSFPLVTIVIPTYNRNGLLQKAIASILSQNYANWELFIVDDGSVDGTDTLVLSIKDARIHLINLTHIGNIAVLRNIGAAAGSGKWIAFLDSDDEWVADKLEKQVRSLQQENKLWSYGGYELMNQASETIPDKYGIYRPISGWITTQLLTCEAAVNIGSLMVHRDLFNETGGFNREPKLIYREDYELTLRLSLLAETLAVPDLLVRVRDHTGRSTNIIDDGYERTAFVYRHFLNLKRGEEYDRIARRRMAYHLAEMSVEYMQSRMYLKATSQLAKAFVHRDKLRHLFSAMYRGLGTGNKVN